MESIVFIRNEHGKYKTLFAQTSLQPETQAKVFVEQFLDIQTFSQITYVKH